MSITIDQDTQNIIDTLENSWDHIFLTGNAGTGKSTILDIFRTNTKKKVAVIAPTGVAAVNVRGETIHSFFKIPPAVTPEMAKEEAKRRRETKIYQVLQCLIIDEISMVRADLLDSIDAFLRTVRKVKLPFGGVQLIMVGDLYQLPPVVSKTEEEAINQAYSSPYFFSSQAFQAINQNLFPLKIIKLEKIHRQSDPVFIGILNRIRKNRADERDLEILNRQIISEGEVIDNYVILTAINAQADNINEARINQIPGTYKKYQAKVSGEFQLGHSSAQESVILKTGARVMLLNNDPDGRWVNGTVGTVFSLKDSSVLVKLDSGELEEVKTHTWSAFKTSYNPNEDKLETLETGSFTQIPLKLAWAITIHKSQGKTFDRVAIDLGRGAFAHGQTYVALSRCTSLSGLKLLRPIAQNHIIVDQRIQEFLDD